MPGWVGKRPTQKLCMIHSSLLEPQNWRRLENKDIKVTVLNRVRHPFNLGLLISNLDHLQMQLSRMRPWRSLPAVSLPCLAAFPPLLLVRLQRWKFPLCTCPEDYLLLSVNLSDLFCTVVMRAGNAPCWASQHCAPIEPASFPSRQLSSWPTDCGITQGLLKV